MRMWGTVDEDVGIGRKGDLAGLQLGRQPGNHRFEIFGWELCDVLRVDQVAAFLQFVKAFWLDIELPPPSNKQLKSVISS